MAGTVTFVVQENIQQLFKKDIKNLSIENIKSVKNKDYDFKIALGSLIKFFYKEKIEFKDFLIQSDRQLNLKWKNQISKSKLNIEVLKVAKKIASKSNLTIKIGKQAFYKQLEMPLKKAYAYTSKMMTLNMMAMDAKEGI